MTDIAALERANAARWHAMTIDPARAASFNATAARLVASKPRFLTVESRLKSLGYYVPWWFVAVVAEREYGGPPHWDKQLSQGDPLGAVSHNDPAGRGPFLGNDAWIRGCLDALIDCAPHAAKWTNWSLGGVLTLLEEYNGLGYAQHGVPSAYVWSGSNEYVSGKFVADHVYRAGVKDVQEGVAPLLKCMAAHDASIVVGGGKPDVTVPPAPKPVPKPTPSAAGGVVVVTGGAAGAAAHWLGVSPSVTLAVIAAVAVIGIAIWNARKAIA